ncbi:MAG: hypothetical protein J0H69_05715 [Burkholderiales bacterium]|nr:hypothetical protein [Burkholderiales bacterium]
MAASSEVIRRVEEGGWTLVFTRGAEDNDDYLYHSVQIVQGETSRSRITVSKPDMATDAVLRLLERRARAWIVDFQSRPVEPPPDAQPLT